MHFSLSCFLCRALLPSLSFSITLFIYTHTHRHTRIYIWIIVFILSTVVHTPFSKESFDYSSLFHFQRYLVNSFLEMEKADVLLEYTIFEFGLCRSIRTEKKVGLFFLLLPTSFAEDSNSFSSLCRP